MATSLTTLLDLPPEILLNILVHSTSLHFYESLLHTANAFHPLVKECAIVIGHGAGTTTTSDGRHCTFDGLNHFNIDQISLELMTHLIQKYHYFIFDISGPLTKLPGFGSSSTMKMLKIMLRFLQERQKYHTVVIGRGSNFNEDVLMRSLMPKFNSQFLEFYIPMPRQINGFEDLRVLDNTRCYFSNLERLTIGSSSFQLFECTAPNLKVFDYSGEMVKQAILYDTVNVRRLSYTKFLSVLARSCAKNVRCLEVLGHVECGVLNQFENLEVLNIYGDHGVDKFDASLFKRLQELVVYPSYTKCSNTLERVTIM